VQAVSQKILLLLLQALHLHCRLICCCWSRTFATNTNSGIRYFISSRGDSHVPCKLALQQSHILSLQQNHRPESWRAWGLSTQQNSLAASSLCLLSHLFYTMHPLVPPTLHMDVGYKRVVVFYLFCQDLRIARQSGLQLTIKSCCLGQPNSPLPCGTQLLRYQDFL
jgi:hypothetical protein